jgi:hypothetical protein
VDRKVAKRVAAVEEQRIAFLRRTMQASSLSDAEAITRAEMAYTLWSGFIARQSRNSGGLTYEQIAQGLFPFLFPSLENLEVKS